MIYGIDDCYQFFFYLFSFALFLQNLEWLRFLNLTQKISLYRIFLLRFPLILLAALLFDPHLPTIPFQFPLFGLWILEVLQWRSESGPANGASSSFTLLILSCLLLGSFFPEQKILFLYYIAAQTILSYFLAGLFKLFQRGWRNGTYLQSFLSLSAYAPDTSLKSFFVERPWLMKTASWLVILFEILFPVALVSPIVMGLFCLSAATFHWVNFKVFGLNRFFWLWISTYPLLFIKFA
jgi:hypothetical protein